MSTRPSTTPPIPDRAMRSLPDSVNLVRQTSGGLTIDVLRSAPLAVIRLTGDFTGNADGQLRDLLEWVVSVGGRDVVVQVDTATAPDAGCLRILRRARTELAARGGQLTATPALPHAQTTLALTGLAETPVSARPAAVAVLV